MDDTKRLFFGMEVQAPWPEELPKGRLLDPAHRHMTLAFLGNIPYSNLQERLPKLPRPDFRIGLIGNFDKLMTLPERNPKVVALHAKWIDDCGPLITYQRELTQYLHAFGYDIKERDWLPHVTICRKPFDLQEWRAKFQAIPFFTGSIHLYESLGNLTYKPIWTYPIPPPFEEIEHTADIAFNIFGKTHRHLYLHAFCALAFKFPHLLNNFEIPIAIDSIDDIVIALNRLISKADSDVGSPFKAVSHHGEIITSTKDQTLHWEMIVDV